MPSQLFLRIDVLDRFDLGTGVASGDFFEPSLGGSERKVDLLLECVLEVSMVQRYTKYLPNIYIYIDTLYTTTYIYIQCVAHILTYATHKRVCMYTICMCMFFKYSLSLTKLILARGPERQSLRPRIKPQTKNGKLPPSQRFFCAVFSSDHGLVGFRSLFGRNICFSFVQHLTQN